MRGNIPSTHQDSFGRGLNVVRVETNSGTERNTHPAALTPEEVGTILRGVRVWEQRNVIHRLVSGQAPKTRAFRDDELAFWRLPFRGLWPRPARPIRCTFT
jgi:hypothetical protein